MSYVSFARFESSVSVIIDHQDLTQKRKSQQSPAERNTGEKTNLEGVTEEGDMIEPFPIDGNVLGLTQRTKRTHFVFIYIRNKYITTSRWTQRTLRKRPANRVNGITIVGMMLAAAWTDGKRVPAANPKQLLSAEMRKRAPMYTAKAKEKLKAFYFPLSFFLFLFLDKSRKRKD